MLASFAKRFESNNLCRNNPVDNASYNNAKG